MKNKNIKLHFKGYEDFISRIDDYMNIVDMNGVFYTPFLLPNEQKVLLSYIGNNAFIKFDGGYDDAESKIAKISFYDYYDDDFDYFILKANYNNKFNNITHRDVFGALMNIGIERSLFGDIIVEDEIIYIIVKEKICDYVIDNLVKINKSKVSFEKCNDKILKKVNFTTTSKVLKSLRLDAIVAACTNLSREKAKVLILSSKVKVNYELLEEVDFLCNNNFVISIRGFGRFKLVIHENKTKKNNYIVDILRFI